MNSLTLESNPVYGQTPAGSDATDKSKDLSVTLAPKAPLHKVSSQPSTDKFEQARLAFFSK